MPFHAAVQHSKDRISDSADLLRCDIPMSPVLCKQEGSRAERGQVTGCSFWFLFEQAVCW